MRSAFEHTAILDHNDTIRQTDCTETMLDDVGCFLFKQGEAHFSLLWNF
jgi:hypothetical protein